MSKRFLLVALVLAGCGESSLDTLCAASSGAWTLYEHARMSCTPNPDPELTDRDYLEQNCRGWIGPMLEHGAVSVSTDDVLAACKAAVRTHTCEPALSKDWFDAVKICEDLLVGHTVTGASCSVDVECGGASFCRREGTCGNCTGQRGPSGACSSDRECQSLLCISGECRPRNVPAGGKCVVDEMCGRGLVCRDRGYCAPLEGYIGSACRGDFDCPRSLSSCADGLCTGLARLGDACTPWNATEPKRPHCRWFDKIGCLSGTCVVLPTAAEGGPCGADVATCAAGAWCRPSGCVTIRPEGALCDLDDQCGPYGVCIAHTCTFSDFAAACAMPD